MLPKAHTACSATDDWGDDKRRTKDATAPALTTALVWLAVPDAIFVRAHAASN